MQNSRGLEGLLIGAGTIGIIAVVLVGAWLLHDRLRTKASLLFPLLLCAALAWGPIVTLALQYLSQSESHTFHFRLEVFGHILLLLAAAVSFLWATLSVRARPN